VVRFAPNFRVSSSPPWPAYSRTAKAYKEPPPAPAAPPTDQPSAASAPGDSTAAAAASSVPSPIVQLGRAALSHLEKGEEVWHLRVLGREAETYAKAERLSPGGKDGRGDQNGTASR